MHNPNLSTYPVILLEKSLLSFWNELYWPQNLTDVLQYNIDWQAVMKHIKEFMSKVWNTTNPKLPT